MEVSKYNQMMSYLTRPRERFGDGGITLNKKGPYKGFYAITLKRGGKNITFRDKDINVVKQKVKEFEATRPPTGGAAVKTKRKVEGISEKNLTRLREIITNKAKERNLPPPNFEKYPGRGYPSNTPGNIMAKDLIRGIKKTGTRGGKDFKTVGTGTGSKALTNPLSKPEQRLLQSTFTDVDFDFTKSKFGIDRKVNPELYRQAVNLVKESPKLVFGFQFNKPENYLLTTFQRARLQQLADTGVSEYVPIYKNEKIIGFQDNTESGGGKKFYHADYKGGASIKTHPNFEKVAKYVNIVKDTRGDHIPVLNKLFTDLGEKVPTFDQLLNNLLDSPGRGGVGSISAAIEKHHTKGVKTSTADLQLLTRDKNKLAALIEGRVDAGKMDFETASRILKPEGIQIEREGVKIGAPDISPEKQVDDLKKFVTRKTLEKFAGNLDDPLAIRLATLGCPGKALGGRIGFQEGTTPTVRCVQAGANIVNEGKFDKLSPSQQKNLTSFLNKATPIGRAVMKFGVIPEAIWVAGASLYDMGRGAGLSEALLRGSDYLLPGNQGKMADRLKFESTMDKETAETILRAKDYKKSLEQLATAKSNLETNQAVLDESDFSYTGNVDAQNQLEVDKQFIKAAEQNVKNKYQRESVLDQAVRSEMEAEDIRGTRDPFYKAMVNARSAETDDFETLFTPEKKQKGVAPPMLTLDDIALANVPDAFLEAERAKIGDAPELTKRNVLDFYRTVEADDGSRPVNEIIFRELFRNARDSSANQERFFGTQGIFARPVIDDFNIRQRSYIQSPFQREEENRLIEEGARFGAAGGGIMKLAGVDSGPAPEKGPTPQGLDFLLKRGR